MSAPIDHYSIENSLVETIASIKNKLKLKYSKKYLPIILGKSLFLGSINYRRSSPRYLTESIVDRIDEILNISSTIRDVTNWLNSGMRIPSVPIKLEEKINEEINMMEANKLCDLESSEKQRIYFLLLSRLKPHCNNGKLSRTYEELGGALENLLSFSSTFIEGYNNFKKDYKLAKNENIKIRLCAIQLEKEEREIAQMFGRMNDSRVLLINNK